MEKAGVADTAATAWVAEPHEHRDQFGHFGVRRQGSAGVDPVENLLDARLHQDAADPVDQRRDLFVETDELVGGHAVLADVVERVTIRNCQRGGSPRQLKLFTYLPMSSASCRFAPDGFPMPKSGPN